MENTITLANGKPAMIPVTKIRQGFNYRRRYDPVGLESLTTSIKTQGLIAPVVVRLLDDGDYQLLAGGRRYKAFVAAFGIESEIPVLERVLTDAEATQIMIAENSEREDPSIIEDAEGASRMLGLVNGSREEAARRLGWNRNKLDRRLALMNATQLVRDAYIDGRLLVGHVEILAALRAEVQDRVASKLLEAPTIASVSELKAMAEQSLLGLEAAIFDKTECAGCQFNSGFQQAMFENSFDGVHCSNRDCFNKKTETELEVRRDQLVETYQVVRIVRPGDNSTVMALRSEGDSGVGAEQAKACRTCGDFGACISAVPDKLGKAFKDVCFNKTCNEDKVAANKKAVKQVEKTQEKAKTETSTQPGPHPGQVSPVKAAPEKADKKEKPVVATVRQAVKDYREQMWRIIFKRAATKLPVLQNRALLVGLLLNSSHHIDSNGARTQIEKELGFKVGSKAVDIAKGLFSLTQEQLAKALQLLPSAVTSTMPISDVVAMLDTMDTSIEGYWKLNETFLDILTKTEIDAVCVEIGLDVAMGKTYVSLKNGSKKDFVASILKVKGFEYVGKVPELMRWAS